MLATLALAVITIDGEVDNIFQFMSAEGTIWVIVKNIYLGVNDEEYIYKYNNNIWLLTADNNWLWTITL